MGPLEGSDRLGRDASGGIVSGSRTGNVPEFERRRPTRRLEPMTAPLTDMTQTLTTGVSPARVLPLAFLLASLDLG